MGASFDPMASYVPAGLKKPVKEALAMGWKPGEKRVTKGGWYIYSPKGTQKFYVPITCKDADELAKKLRSLMSKAFLSEKSAFAKHYPPKDEVSELMRGVHVLQDAGATVIPGTVPLIRCNDCDTEFPGWEQYASHQDVCQANVKAALAAKQERAVPKEGQGADRPSEGVSQDVTESTESVHSGTISTKEETPLATESSTPAPKPAPPKTGRRRGYTWTQVTGKENPLHEILYEAVRYNRRLKDEVDSKYSLRLAQYIESEDLLSRLSFGDPDMQATSILEKIRDLVGGGEQENEEAAQTIKQLQEDVATKTTEIEALTKKYTDLRAVLSTFSDLANEAKEAN